MSKRSLQYRRRLQFYETDAMGIIHHGCYLYIFEEARLEFLRELHGGADGNLLEGVNYPLVSCEVDFKKPLHFNEEVVVDFTVSREGARLVFDYELSTKTFDKPVAFGKTVHVAFDMQTRKPTKMPQKVLDYLEG